MTRLIESVVLQPLITPNDDGEDILHRPRTERYSFAQIAESIDVPTLIETQITSFQWFLKEGLRELFDEISPITDFTGRNIELRFIDYHFGEPRHTEHECRARDMTFDAPLRVKVQIRIFTTGELKESDIYLGNFPMMTDNGTFVINGTERVVVSQLIRSPGVYFRIVEDKDRNSSKRMHNAKLIPSRGAWIEFETSRRDQLYVKVNSKRKLPVTTLLRAIMAWRARPDGSGLWIADSELEQNGRDDDILRLFEHLPANEMAYIRATLDKDTTHTSREALLEFHKKLRPGEPARVEDARSQLETLIFSPRRYDLGRVGRYKLNRNLWEKDIRADDRLSTPDLSVRVLLPSDITKIIERIIQLNVGIPNLRPDNIDHLGNRRVRTVGELIQQYFRNGLLRMERMIRDRLVAIDPESVTPNSLVNIRPVTAAIREFFGGSQLSQFMEQTNPLAELTNKRRLSALGPGGLSRDRAGFEVRDVHHSHYGRICPVETPEGPNIGLIGTMSTFARVNDMGFLETPYRKVYREIPNAVEFERIGILVRDIKDLRTGQLIAMRGSRMDRASAERIAIELLRGQILREDIVSDVDDTIIGEAGQEINRLLAERIVATSQRTIRIRPVVSREVDYLSADEEEKFTIAQANAPLDQFNRFEEGSISCRIGDIFDNAAIDRIDYMDVSPKQVVSVSTALIPFLEHDDANRALMGSNMQRQAVPLLRPDSPIVGTGMEYLAARDSGQVIVARSSGVVLSATGDRIVVLNDDGTEHEYHLRKFMRSNQDTCINQRPSVARGQRVEQGSIIADSSSTDNGELALGQNVLVAFMPWEGGNFEDAILVSERLVREDIFTSIHIEKHDVEARETKLGAEEITRDIPNVGSESMRHLNEEGIIYVGAEVQPNDILVGKVTPKGETDLTAEERLLRAIFGEKAKEVKDTSLRVPNGVRGKVIDVRIFERDTDTELPVGVLKRVDVLLCQKRKISAGDKMAGRHGNKGVVSRILPVEDMPFLSDGRPVDIILNPIGVPSRMNLGQILETHLGWAAARLGYKIATPVFDGASEATIKDWLGRAGLSTDGKTRLFDGRTGEPFSNPITVGYIYMLKLAHLVEDKIHARSTGPYSLVTQQPLGGKAQFGGQRLGEMEVWALEAYGAAYILQEMLTVKSDDVVGRVKTYEAIVKGQPIQEAGVPESFKVLIKELRALGLSVEVLSDDDRPVELNDDIESDYPPLEVNMSGIERGLGHDER
jgi:DNA-directed RNA polymerase subunit beta